MANPTVTAVLDKATYAPGDPVTLTVSYGDADTKASTVTVTGTDAAGNPATVTVNLNVSDPVALTVSDDGGRAWAKGADNGSTAVFTATA
jgi:hypothetical protein